MFLKNKSLYLNLFFKQNQVRFLNYQPIDSKNLIKVGHKMTQVIEKKRIKYLDSSNNEKKPYFNKLKEKMLISCSNSQFNHYTNQKYKDYDNDKYLFSSSWFSRRSAGKYFTINSLGTHPSLNHDPDNIKFEQLQNMNQNLIELLKTNMNITTPTSIQKISFSQILEHMNHYLIVAETSGGKTLAYLLPLIDTIVKLNLYLRKLSIKRSLNEPIGIICVPTRELVFQIYDTLKMLLNFDHYSDLNQNEYLRQLSKIRFVIDLKEGQLMAREKVRQIQIDKLETKTKETDQKPIDILITVPSRLESKLNEKKIKSTYLKKLIFDEADTLLDDSFHLSTLNCIQFLNLNLELPKEPNKIEDLSTQLLFVSATTPLDLRKSLNNLIGETQLKLLKTSQSNRLMLHVPQKFIRSNGEKRMVDFLEQVKCDMKMNRTVLVFSNKTKTAIFVSKFLKENQIDCELITKLISNEGRENIMEKFSTGKLKCLSATDIASRGWDTLNVNHVINFEMPIYMADYVHRVGRVGRLSNSNRHSQITNYVTKKYEIDLVMNIERSVRFNQDITNKLDGNIRKLIKNEFFSRNK